MEPVSARNAFPCFDEPEFKARFKISVVHNQNLKVLSNMPTSAVKNM
jgi:aminopeptidase N